MLKKIMLIAAVSSFLPAFMVKTPSPTDIDGLATSDVKITHHYLDKRDTRTTSSVTEDPSVCVGNSFVVNVQDDRAFVAGFKDKTLIPEMTGSGSYSFVADYSETSFDLCYASDDETRLVIVVDSSNHYLGYAAIPPGDFIGSDAFIDWKMYALSPFRIETFVDPDGNEVTSQYPVTKNMIIRPGSYKTYDLPSFDVSVFGKSSAYIDRIGTNYKRVQLDSQVTVTSTSDNFSYWQIGNKIVSYKANYTFSVYSDVLVKEIQDIVSTPKPIVNLYHKSYKDMGPDTLYNDKIDVIGYELPDGYSFVETGEIFGGKELGAEGVSKVKASKISKNNEFAVKHVNDATKRAYLIYRTPDNKTQVIYDDGYGYEQLNFLDVDNTNKGDADAAEDALNKSSTGIGGDWGIDVSDSEPCSTVDGEDHYGAGALLGDDYDSEMTIWLSERKADMAIVYARPYGDSPSSSITIGDNEMKSNADTLSALHFYFDESSSPKIIGSSEYPTLVQFIELFYSDRQRNDTELSAYMLRVDLGETMNIRSDTLSLPDSISGFHITWTSSDNSLINPETGAVTVREDDATCTITGMISDDETSAGRIYDCKVIGATTLANDDIFANINIPNDVTSDFSIPTSINGTALSWATSDSAHLTADGKISRDKEVDNTVILTVSFTYKGFSFTRPYYVKVRSTKVKNIYLSAFSLGFGTEACDYRSVSTPVLEVLNDLGNPAVYISYDHVGYSGIDHNDNYQFEYNAMLGYRSAIYSVALPIQGNITKISCEAKYNNDLRGQIIIEGSTSEISLPSNTDNAYAAKYTGTTIYAEFSEESRYRYFCIAKSDAIGLVQISNIRITYV